MGTWTFENVKLHSCVPVVVSFLRVVLHIFSESLHRLGSIKPSVVCTLMQFVG